MCYFHKRHLSLYKESGTRKIFFNVATKVTDPDYSYRLNSLTRLKIVIPIIYSLLFFCTVLNPYRGFRIGFPKTWKIKINFKCLKSGLWLTYCKLKIVTNFVFRHRICQLIPHISIIEHLRVWQVAKWDNLSLQVDFSFCTNYSNSNFTTFGLINL